MLSADTHLRLGSLSCSWQPITCRRLEGKCVAAPAVDHCKLLMSSSHMLLGFRSSVCTHVQKYCKLRIDLGSWMSITHQYQDNIAADDALLLYWGTLARTMNLSLNCWFHFWYFCFQCVRNGSIPIKVVHKLKAFRKLWWRCPEPKPSSSECRPNPKPSKSQWANGLLLHAQLLPTEV